MTMKLGHESLHRPAGEMRPALKEEEEKPIGIGLPVRGRQKIRLEFAGGGEGGPKALASATRTAASVSCELQTLQQTRH
jgi:hypothetical protein